MTQRSALPALAALALCGLNNVLAQPATADAAKLGTIVTVAGTGVPGYSGDGGPATQAQLNAPGGIAIDADGNLFISDSRNARVRKVSPDGMITTVAGTGQPGFSGDGGKATDAQLNPLSGVAVDRTGNLYINDYFNHRIRKVTPDGIISTYAGSGPVETTSDLSKPFRYGAFSGDNGPANEARLNRPTGLAVDAAGNLFIADFFNLRVRKVDVVTGVITTAVGNGSNRSSGDGGPATEAGISPFALAFNAMGDLFITDITDSTNTFRVRKVTPDGIISTVAGTGKVGFSGDGGPATSGRLSDPDGLAVDSVGNLFISDYGNYRVRKVDAVTGVITTVAGNGKKPYAGDGGLATETGLRGPGGLAIDAVGNLILADSGYFHHADGDGLLYNERVLKVFEVAAPGLLSGMLLPMPGQP